MSSYHNYYFTLIVLASCYLSGCNRSDNVGNNLVHNEVSKSKEVRVYLAGRDECAIPAGYAMNGKKSPENDTVWHLRLSKDGSILWNGVPTPIDKIDGYLSWVMNLKVHSEFVSLEIEDGTNCARVEEIRKKEIDSGLCRDKRCTENDWNIKRPYVN